VWKVENSNLITPGNGPELINDSSLKICKLYVEFKADTDSNSRIPARPVRSSAETDSAGEPPSHHTGGVYGLLAPTGTARKPGEWRAISR
jgi:hypothetical protein